MRQLLQYIAYFTALQTLGPDWLLIESSVAGATFMNKFATYTMIASSFNQFHEVHSSKIYSNWFYLTFCNAIILCENLVATYEELIFKTAYIHLYNFAF